MVGCDGAAAGLEVGEQQVHEPVEHAAHHEGDGHHDDEVVAVAGNKDHDGAPGCASPVSQLAAPAATGWLGVGVAARRSAARRAWVRRARRVRTRLTIALRATAPIMKTM